MLETIVESEYIYSSHLNLIKTKFEKEFRAFMKSVDSRVSYYITK